MKVMPPAPAMVKNWNDGDQYQHVDTGEYQVVAKGKKPKSGKLKPTKKKSKHPPNRQIVINTNQLVRDCSNLDDFVPELIDYQYYIDEAKKLVHPLLQ